MSDPNWRKRPKFWTPAKLMELDEHLHEGLSDAEVGRLMGKSADSIKIARLRRLKRSREHYVLTARHVADLLGFGCSKKVRELIRMRALRARRGPKRGPHAQWQIRYDDVLAFLDKSEFWQWWEPGTITDPNIRATYTDLRQERYLTQTAVADVCFVEPKTVYQWIRKGYLPAVRKGNWLIPQSALVGFVPPGQRPRKAA